MTYASDDQSPQIYQYFFLMDSWKLYLHFYHWKTNKKI